MEPTTRTRGLFHALFCFPTGVCLPLVSGGVTHTCGESEAVWGYMAAGSQDSTASVPSLPIPGFVLQIWGPPPGLALFARTPSVLSAGVTVPDPADTAAVGAMGAVLAVVSCFCLGS